MFQRLGIKKTRICPRSPAEPVSPKAEHESAPLDSKTQLVSVSRTKASFPRLLNLPVPLMTLISTFWNQQDVHQLNRAFIGLYFYYSWSQAVANRASDEKSLILYRPMGAFLHRLYNVLPMEAKLLNHVVNADYKQVKKAIDRNPSSMFTPVNFRYRDGSSERISPLKYAFKVYDTYMWLLFYKKIKNNPQDVEKFIEQANEQITHIDLDPLFEAYEEYEKEQQRFEQYRNNVLRGFLPFSLNELIKAKKKLGTMQRKLLPAHMWIEISREGSTWNFNSTFDVDAQPPASNQCQIYDSENRLWRSVASIIAEPTKDVDFTLMRGIESSTAKTVGSVEMFFTSIIDDSDIIRGLLEIRKEDLARHMTLLVQSSHKNSPACRLSSSE